jgi:hypothetical protein
MLPRVATSSRAVLSACTSSNICWAPVSLKRLHLKMLLYTLRTGIVLYAYLNPTYEANVKSNRACLGQKLAASLSMK